MMLCGWVQEQITMKFRIHTKLINRGLTLLLLSLVLVATLFILQLFLYHEKHNSISTHNINTIWPYLNTNYDRAEDLKSGDSLRPATLSQHHKFSDLKYNQLKMYHRKGLTLRRQFDCQQLFENSSSEQKKVVEFHTQNQNTYPVIANDIATAFTSDCEAFKTIRQYRTDRGSFIEGEFPLAYVILVHKDFEHVERLLRTIYMPQHSICIHVDDKAPDSLKEAVASLASCFTNVILASKPQGIVYAHVSRLLADVICMSDLLKKDKSWRYLINYAATEFPLRTNLETVKILNLLHGLNDIHEQYERRLQDRFKTEYRVDNGRMKQTNVKLPPPPFNMTIIKGQAYNTYSRKFLEWMVSDDKPRKLLEWSNKTFSPDEHYWATLNDLYHNSFLDSPGGFKGHPDKKGYITRFISWQYSKPRFKCHGRSVRNICNFSALDLPIFISEMHLAANKFDLTYDPIAYACMEELIQNKTLAQLPFNLQDYSRLYFINYKSSDS